MVGWGEGRGERGESRERNCGWWKRASQSCQSGGGGGGGKCVWPWRDTHADATGATATGATEIAGARESRYSVEYSIAPHLTVHAARPRKTFSLRHAIYTRGPRRVSLGTRAPLAMSGSDSPTFFHGQPWSSWIERIGRDKPLSKCAQSVHRDAAAACPQPLAAAATATGVGGART